MQKVDKLSVPLICKSDRSNGQNVRKWQDWARFMNKELTIGNSSMQLIPSRSVSMNYT